MEQISGDPPCFFCLAQQIGNMLKVKSQIILGREKYNFFHVCFLHKCSLLYRTLELLIFLTVIPVFHIIRDDFFSNRL